MASFGGTVKLTGESEYRKALTQITQNLRETSSALSLVDSQYAKNDNSIATVTAKNEKLNAILEKQKSAYNGLKSSFDNIKSKYDEQVNAHNKLQKEYDEEKSKLEKLKNTVGENSSAYEKQKTKVADLATQLNKSKTNIDANEVAMSKLRVQMNNAETAINKTTKEIDDLGKETKETAKEVKSAGDGFTVFKGILSNLASKGISLAISGLKKLGNVAIDVGKQAIESYADYEQLTGGVETLFKDSADIVKGYAKEAYKTAGLSANEYMETVTSFSASLLQGLKGDTKKAAEIADLAIKDMSDNANKMGTSMELIQNAYQGFAKQNYTMLDNLKLGYGGTKAEMARLVKESGILGKAGEDLTAKNFDQKVSYDQIILAIHKVQENMGITGTTAKEASSTISGSVNQMKKSWKNLLTAIADDNADLGKSVKEFTDSAAIAAKNLVPRIKVAVEGIKGLINSIITDVFPRLKREVPQLRPLIEVFEWFIKNKTLVINAVKAMVAAFAVAKIAQFTKSLSDGSKGLIDMVKNMALATTATNANTTATVANATAQTTGTVATKALTVAQGLLNKVWAANPIGLVIAGVVALVAVMNKLTEKSKKLAEQEQENYDAIQMETQKVKDNKQAWDELTQSRQDTINVGMTELSNYKALYKELESIVDENGKVKAGYEARASFITSTLRDALGVEIELIGNQVQGMQNLRDSINEVIEKKKAQIILSTQEEQYTEALNKQMEAVRQLTEYENKLAEEKTKAEEINNAITEAERKYAGAVAAESLVLAYRYQKEIDNAKKRKATWEQGVADLENSITQEQNLISEYTYNIGQYEANMALAHEGKYNEMSNVTWEYVKDYSNATDAEKAMLEGNVANTTKLLDILKQNRTEANADIIDGEIEKNERLLSEQQKALNDYNAKTTSALNNTKTIWNGGLAEQISAITGVQVEFRDAGNDQVQAYVNGIAAGEPKTKAQMSELTSEAINEINKQKGNATTAGSNLLDGVNNGISNPYKQSSIIGSITSLGSRILANFRASLQEHSPSKATKEMGQYLLEGLGLGMEKEEDGILKQANDFGKSLIGSINGGLSGTIKTSAISDIGNSMSSIGAIRNNRNNIAEIQAESNRSIIDDFKAALAEMKIELDDENMGKFVDKTVAKTIYS